MMPPATYNGFPVIFCCNTGCPEYMRRAKCFLGPNPPETCNWCGTPFIFPGASAAARGKSAGKGFGDKGKSNQLQKGQKGYGKVGGGLFKGSSNDRGRPLQRQPGAARESSGGSSRRGIQSATAAEILKLVPAQDRVRAAKLFGDAGVVTKAESVVEFEDSLREWKMAQASAKEARNAFEQQQAKFQRLLRQAQECSLRCDNLKEDLMVAEQKAADSATRHSESIRRQAELPPPPSMPPPPPPGSGAGDELARLLPSLVHGIAGILDRYGASAQLRTDLETHFASVFAEADDAIGGPEVTMTPAVDVASCSDGDEGIEFPHDWGSQTVETESEQRDALADLASQQLCLQKLVTGKTAKVDDKPN
jgi:hypothetical protein